MFSVNPSIKVQANEWIVDTSIKELNSNRRRISSQAAFVYVMTPIRCPRSHRCFPLFSLRYARTFTSDLVLPEPAPAYRKKLLGLWGAKHDAIWSSTDASMSFASSMILLGIWTACTVGSGNNLGLLLT